MAAKRAHTLTLPRYTIGHNCVRRDMPGLPPTHSKRAHTVAFRHRVEHNIYLILEDSCSLCSASNPS